MADATIPGFGTRSKADAKKLALWAVIGSAALTAANQWTQQGGVSARVWVAAWVAAIVFTLAAEVAPRPASALAILVLVTAVVVTGPNVWTELSKRVAGEGGPPDERTDVPPGSRGRAQQPDELRDTPSGGGLMVT